MEGEDQSSSWSRSVSVHPHRSCGCRFKTQGLRKIFLLSMQGQMLQGELDAPGIFQGWHNGGERSDPRGTGDALSPMSWWDVTALATPTAPLPSLPPPCLLHSPSNKGDFPAWPSTRKRVRKAGGHGDVPPLGRTEPKSPTENSQ